MSELIDGFGSGDQAEFYWPYGLARAHAWMDDADNAFRYLDDLSVDFFDLLTLDLDSPFFDRIKDDPRWPAFLERIGASPEQLAAVEFDVVIPR